jgi:hypothetical protein
MAASPRHQHDPDQEPLVLHSSLLGLAASIATPALLIALGLTGVGAGPEAGTVPVILLVAGALTGGYAAVNFPRHVIVSTAGVTRVCWARRHHLPWTAIRAITRAPRSRGRARQQLREAPGAEPDQHEVTTGLLARGHGRRNWMLTDQVESRAQYDRLATVLDGVPETTLRAPRPPVDATPTDLYRRRS